MEKNEIMVLGEILFHLYDDTDPLTRKRQLLSSLKSLLSCSYASILHAAPGAAGGLPAFCDPICDPESFLPAEEAYIRLSSEDHRSTRTVTAALLSMIPCRPTCLPGRSSSGF